MEIILGKKKHIILQNHSYVVYRELQAKTSHKIFTTLPLVLCDSAFGVWVELSIFTLKFLTAGHQQNPYKVDLHV